MSSEPVRDAILSDPLSEVTRKERRMLLGVSTLAITLVKTGLVPTKITALGLEFDQTDQQSLLSMLGVVTVYFLAAFVIYAAADLLAWRRAMQREARAQFTERLKIRVNRLPDEEYEHRRWAGALNQISMPVAGVRALFEFGVPFFVGVYALRLLFQ